jgi:hypothetical protein
MGTTTRYDQLESGFAKAPFITKPVYTTVPGTDPAGVQQVKCPVDPFRQFPALVQYDISGRIFL